MTDTPVNTWELAQNIPEDMSKPQNPLPVTITPGKDGQSDIIEDMDFSFDGYQVVRGEFFAHTFEPSFTFNNYKEMCIRDRIYSARSAPELLNSPVFSNTINLRSACLLYTSHTSSAVSPFNTP